jgi:hypothetical protein
MGVLWEGIMMVDLFGVKEQARFCGEDFDL